MTSPNNTNYPQKLFPILMCILIAAGLGMVLSLFIAQFNARPVFSVAIPVIISVPLGLLGAKGWEKGFRNVSRDDVITSIMGGVGATIGVVIFLLFL